MELRHLRYFVAVAEEQNVTRAAARLHVSQPPLTRQIQDLEAEMGVALFERTARSIRLTKAGRVFLSEAKAALQCVEAAVTAARATAIGKGRELHIGHAPSATADFLPSVLRAFHQKLPGVRVTLHDMTATEILDGLHEGCLDAGFLVKPERKLARDVRFQPLRSYPMVVAVAPGHPWTKRLEVKVSEVLQEPIVAYSRHDYPNYHRLLVRVLGPRIRKLPLAEECDSGPSLVAAVESGKGACVVPAFLATTAGTRLRYVALSPPAVPAVVGMAFMEGSPTLPLQMLREAAQAVTDLPRSMSAGSSRLVGQH
jgi:DNA-binding transcriptional LysR family regulator